MNNQIVRGALEDGTTPGDIKFRDVSNRLTRKKPSKSPLYVALRNLRKGEPARSSKIEWYETDVVPRNTTANGSAAAGAAGASVTIPVQDDIYIADDVIQLPNNATAPGALVQVVGVNAGSIEVRRVDGGSETAWGTVPAIGDGELLRRIGNEKKEFFKASESRVTHPAFEYNYCQRDDSVIAQSNTKKASADYGGDSWHTNRDHQIWDWQTNQEERLFFGKREIKKVGSEVRHFMGGVDFFGLPKSFTYSASSFDVPKLMDIVREIFVGNDGSDIRYLYAGSQLVQDIMLLDDDKIQKGQVDSALLQRKVPVIDFGFGVLRIIHEQLFDERQQSRLGFVLDHENLTIRELNPMKLLPRNLEEAEGRDGEELQIKCEWSLEVRYLETHAKIEGTA